MQLLREQTDQNPDIRSAAFTLDGKGAGATNSKGSIDSETSWQRMK